MKQQIFFLFLLISMSSFVYGQTTCNSFNTVGDWTTFLCNPNNTGLSTGVPANTPAANAGIDPLFGGGSFFQAADEPYESSYLWNYIGFSGDFHNNIDKEISFDYVVFDDGFSGGNGGNVDKLFYLRGYADGEDIEAVFRLNATTQINETSGWEHITVPVKLAVDGVLPSNTQGYWDMTNGGTAEDWNTLIKNLNSVAFDLNVLSSAATDGEMIGIDNFCIDCDDDALVSNFYLEGGNSGKGGKKYYCDQDIYLNGSTSENYRHYEIKIWKRPITTGGLSLPWQFHRNIGPIVGQLGTINLRYFHYNANGDYYATTFETGYQYRVLLRVDNGCYHQANKYRTFKIVELPYDKGFEVSEPNFAPNNSYSVTTTPNSNIMPISHMWKIYYETSDGQGPDFNNPVTNDPFVMAETKTFTNLTVNTSYRIIHGVWKVDCFDWDWTSNSVNIQLREGSGKESYEIVYGDNTELNSKDMQILSDQMNNGNTVKELKRDDASNTTQNTIHVYPNPTTNASTIQVETGGIAIKHIELIDMSGRQIRISSNEIANNKSSFTINETISSGIYVVRVLTEDDNVLMNKLVIK